MKVITGKLNFTFQAYNLNDFLRDMDNYNCEVLDIKSSFTTHIVTIRGKDDDLDHARWYFRHCGSLI